MLPQNRLFCLCLLCGQRVAQRRLDKSTSLFLLGRVPGPAPPAFPRARWLGLGSPPDTPGFGWAFLSPSGCSSPRREKRLRGFVQGGWARGVGDPRPAAERGARGMAARAGVGTRRRPHAGHVRQLRPAAAPAARSIGWAASRAEGAQLTGVPSSDWPQGEGAGPARAAVRPRPGSPRRRHVPLAGPGRGPPPPRR